MKFCTELENSIATASRPHVLRQRYSPPSNFFPDFHASLTFEGSARESHLLFELRVDRISLPTQGMQSGQLARPRNLTYLTGKELSDGLDSENFDGTASEEECEDLPTASPTLVRCPIRFVITNDTEEFRNTKKAIYDNSGISNHLTAE